ncbi:hypothetical protein ACFSUK_25775 [Sphingobium scionense]
MDDADLVYAETLSSADKLVFQPVGVGEVAVLARKIVSEAPIIVAIDYRLDEQPASLAADQTYKGSALAQHLRDASIEHPDQDFALVLVSAESKIKTLYHRIRPRMTCLTGFTSRKTLTISARLSVRNSSACVTGMRSSAP